MGVLDFLKITIFDKKPKTKPGAKPATKRAANVIEVDSKTFPLAAITTKGFVVTGFDDSLIRGQNARITVKVDDAFAKFSFATTIAVNEVKDGKMVGEWMMLDPQLETLIRKYGQIKKQKSGG
ncbi:hypothetical protein [Azospirillum sp.]|uniref:hypothetical protein n=1 Tax=Azospirillum sp. TaxID=34012 RepID=UPI002D6B2958|nr:hypothetical protein [Azospirillum sp.]HYD64790.1 hypothetical protein [Azospirillum sp.]